LPGRCRESWSPPLGGLELPAGAARAQPEGGQASQVDRGGQQLKVLGHAHQSPHAGTAATVAAAQQVRQLALDLGPGGPIVGQPGGITLTGTGAGQLALTGMDARVNGTAIPYPSQPPTSGSAASHAEAA
jgi:hypothetical protein